MYWWHLVNRKESELIYKCLQAQQLFPEKNDWAQLITKDMEDLIINLHEDDLKKYQRKPSKNMSWKKWKVFADIR